MKTITRIEAVIQANPCGPTWYAGFGYQGTDGSNLISGGCYLETTHRTKKEAKEAARNHAEAYRNTVLTLGGCTLETLPRIIQVQVGN